MSGIKNIRFNLRATLAATLMFAIALTSDKLYNSEYLTSLYLMLFDCIIFIMYATLNFNTWFEKFLKLYQDYKSIQTFGPTVQELQKALNEINLENKK